jgi:putative Mn2+ efflux pump MntP
VDIVTVVLIAFALAMDAFAVAVASGLYIHRLHVNHALRIAGMFGLFQGAMPLAGWLAGRTAQRMVAAIDHWLVFALLAGIGGKMVYESWRLDDRQGFDPLAMSFLLLLSIATSIDALAVGVSYGLLDVAVATPALVIGAVTFGLSLAGVILGDRIGHLFERRLEAIGGVILIGIGLRILIMHLW